MSLITWFKRVLSLHADSNQAYDALRSEMEKTVVITNGMRQMANDLVLAREAVQAKVKAVSALGKEDEHPAKRSKLESSHG